MNEIVTMNGKQYKKVLPCGLLRTRKGHQYYLLHPEPVTKDSWQRDEQQRFVVVPGDDEYIEIFKDHLLYSYSRHLVTTNPDIEYCCFRTFLYVEYLGELDVESVPQETEQDFDLLDFPPPNLSADEWEKLLQDAEEARI